MYKFLIVFLFITTHFIHAEFWTDVGGKLAEIQDTTSGLIKDTAEATGKWWDEEGEECFDRARDNVAKSFKATTVYMKQATADINKGYIKYWDEHDTPKNERVVFNDDFFKGFLKWWDEQGQMYFDYVIDGYRHFIENFKDYRLKYYDKRY